MADNFTIEYAFVAIDRFTEVTQKIQAALTNVRKSLGQITVQSKIANDSVMELGAANVMTAEAGMGLSKGVSSMGTGLARARSGINKWSLSVGGAAGKLELLREKMATFGDQRAMGSYYKLMNIGLPVFLLAKAGLSYEDSMEHANELLKVQFSSSDAQLTMQKQLQASATNAQNTTAISAAQYMEGVATLGLLMHNIQAAQKAMPELEAYAVLTKQTGNMAAAAKSLGGDVSKGEILKTKLTGATPAERYAQAMIVIDKSLGNIVALNAKTTGTQFLILGHILGNVASAITTSLEPALVIMHTNLLKITKVLLPFIEIHEKLVATIASLIILSLGFVVVETILGAVLTIGALFISAMITGLELLGGALTGLVFIIKNVGKAFEFLTIEFLDDPLTAPFIITGMLLIFLIAHWVIFSDGIKKTIAFMKDYFDSAPFANFLKNLNEVVKALKVLFQMMEKGEKLIKTQYGVDAITKHMTQGLKKKFPAIISHATQGVNKLSKNTNNTHVIITMKDKDRQVKKVEVRHSMGNQKSNQYVALGANMGSTIGLY